jgi:hypothetical protein
MVWEYVILEFFLATSPIYLGSSDHHLQWLSNMSYILFNISPSKASFSKTGPVWGLVPMGGGRLQGKGIGR